MDDTALADLLTTANKITPPKPEVLARLGKLIADEPAFFNVQAGLTRFDVDRKGTPTTGYGFTTQLEREPIYELVFSVSDLVREGLQPCYLRKLYAIAVAHPEWLGITGELPPLGERATVLVDDVTKPLGGRPTITGQKMTAAERKRRFRERINK